MSNARRPTFLQHTEPLTMERLRVENTGPMTRRVAWASAPDEPANISPLPMQALTPPPQRAVETPPPAPVSAFAPLPPMPSPPPPALAPATRELSPRVLAAIEALKAETRRLGEQARSDALEIGLLVARKILEREISASLEPLFGLIRSAIHRAGEANQTVVRVCAADASRLHDSGEATLALGRVEIVADETLSPGDVLVTTEHHTVDGRLETRLGEVGRELDEALNGARA